MKLYHGAAFYPELWDEKTIIEDIEKMKDLGINVVRIGEFWWSILEPDMDNFRFDFVRKILDLLHKNNIDVIMCTPTATPPIWVTHNNQSVLHVDENNNKMIHGSRQHACTNNDYFRERVKIIVEKLAENIGSHPSIILWQIDNELKCHVSECYCENCKTLWHSWLEDNYKDINSLNKKWGLNIWSEAYQSFEQVPQPFKSTPFIHHASLSTMYKKFHREKIVDFASLQYDIIKKYSNKDITTNTGLGFSLNNELLFSKLDCVGFDTYAPYHLSHAFILNCDIWRNMKKGKEYWLLETGASHTGALDRHADIHPPKYLLAESIVNYALGGKSFLYWLWRQQAFGSEISHSAAINSWGTPSIGYNDISSVENERKKIEPYILNSICKQGDIAITYSDISKMFFETESHKKNSYRGLITDLQELIIETGIHRDWIPENYSLDGYKILISPFIYNLSEEYIKKAEEFVRNGGVWIVGPMTNIRTGEHTANIDKGLGEYFEKLAGIETLYFAPLENSGAEGEAFGIKAPLKLYSSIFKPVDSKSLGNIIGTNANNNSFICEKELGKGKIVSIGSLPYGESGKEILKTLIQNYYDNENFIVADTGIIVVPRMHKTIKEKTYYFLINLKK